MNLVLIAFVRLAKGEDDQTDITLNLNNQIRPSESGLSDYTGGLGVLVRNPFDNYEQNTEFAVVPATFWSNDIYAPSQLYPSSAGVSDKWDDTKLNPDCPNDGWNGFFVTYPVCMADPGNPTENSPWNYASSAYVIGSGMWNLFKDFDNIQSEDWGWGVFYPSDSNSIDFRCRYLDDYKGYDCGPEPSGGWHGGWIPTEGDDAGKWFEDQTKHGTGFYPPGNPDAFGLEGGGGSGCHFDKGGTMIMDQTDAFDGNGKNLVMDHHCQCNYGGFGQDDQWSKWIEHWIQYAVPKPGLEYEGWFQGGLAPNRALDQVSCWVNNPRDMIQLQNQIWWKRFVWNNQLTPKSYWSDDPASHRLYWGWNEIPVGKVEVTDPSNHDAVLIKLPAGICGDGGWNDKIPCLGDGGQIALEREFDKWVDGPLGNMMVPGLDNVANQPGSYVVLVREFIDDSGNWNKYFYCENWTSPNNKWKIVFEQMTSWNPTGSCYLDYGASYSLHAERNQTVV